MRPLFARPLASVLPLACALVVAGLTALVAPRNAHADPPRASATAPKVCVVVGGDPDTAVVAAATRLADALARRADVRSVADADARAVLRGEARPDPRFAPLATARRALAGDDTDAQSLDALGERLGCAVAVELLSRPAGVMLRSYDVVHHTFQGRAEMPTLDAPTVIDSLVLPAARAAAAPAASSAATATTTTPPPTAVTTPPSSASNTATATATTATTPVAAQAAATGTASATTTPATPVDPTTPTPPVATPPTATPGTASATTPAPTTAASTTSPATATARAATTPAPRGATVARPGIAVGGTSSRPAPRTNRRAPDRGPGIAAWAVAGGAAALLIGGFVIAQVATPGTPVIQVVRPPTGSGASP